MMLDLLLALEGPGDGHGAGSAQVLDIANWLPGVTALVVFLIAFAVLATKVWPTITKALDEREAKIRNEIKSAEEAREQAKAALAQYERELANARNEANAMIQKARAEAKATADELRARNEAELADLRGRAQRDIQAAKARAIAEIHAEAANLAVAVASRILKKEITVEDQRGLVDDTIRGLSGMKN